MMRESDETIKIKDFTIEVCTEIEEITIGDGYDSICITSDKLVPLVLALLELILEKGWHADADV